VGGRARERPYPRSFLIASKLVDPNYRPAFNAAFSDALFADYRGRLESVVGKASFRLAETPFFMPPALRDRLDAHARSILALIGEPARVEAMRAAIPARFDTPHMDALPSSAQVDFAIVRNAQGELDGRIVELQGFPSLYAFTLLQARAWSDTLHARAGFKDSFSPTFGGLDDAAAISAMRTAITGGEDPESVVLLDLEPTNQKTFCDFVATRSLLGIEPVCVTELVREGRRLFRTSGGKRIPVKRIYNRVVFDELEKKGLTLPFAYTDDLDVTWCPHPNWYWVWSKYTLPQVSHPAIPRARLLSDVHEVPADLGHYVLKPLFSFAGSGVVIDVTKEHLASIPATERSGWLLQEKIEYARELVTPDGSQVAVEVRVMCLRAPSETALRPVLNLVRLSRGKMHGVDHNKDMKWTGSSVGISPQGR
jgi:hypothetical protein